MVFPSDTLKGEPAAGGRLCPWPATRSRLDDISRGNCGVGRPDYSRHWLQVLQLRIRLTNRPYNGLVIVSAKSCRRELTSVSDWQNGSGLCASWLPGVIESLPEVEQNRRARDKEV